MPKRYACHICGLKPCETPGSCARQAQEDEWEPPESEPLWD